MQSDVPRANYVQTPKLGHSVICSFTLFNKQKDKENTFCVFTDELNFIC